MRASQRSMGGRSHPSAVAGRLTGARPAMPPPEQPDQPMPGYASSMPGSTTPDELATMRSVLGGMNTGGGMKTGGGA
jgi:hypothetical protein